jgi:hypothetical protein
MIRAAGLGFVASAVAALLACAGIVLFDWDMPREVNL